MTLIIMENLTLAEQIMSIMNKDRKQRESLAANDNNISDGTISINQKNITIAQRYFMNRRVRMLVPEEMEPMLEASADIKYPSKDRPQWIFTMEDSTVDMTLAISDEMSRDEDTEEIKERVMAWMQTIYPISAIKDNNTIMPFGKSISFFSFNLPLHDGMVCQMMYFTILHRKELIGTFSCPWDYGDEWRPVWIQMLHTLESNLGIG